MAKRTKPKAAKSAELYQGSEKPSALIQFADLSLYTDRVNKIDGEFDLFWKARFGPVPVDSAGVNYSLFFTNARLQLVLAGLADVPAAPRFRQAIPDDDAKREFVVRREETLSAEAKASLEAKLQAFIAFDGKIEGDAKRSSATTDTVTVKSRFMVVEPINDTSWAIGHDVHGDIRKTGMCLKGEYGSGIDGCTDPLLRLSVKAAKPTKGHRSVTATLAIRKERIKVVKDGHNPSDRAIHSDETPAIIEALKDRLRSMKLMSAMDVTSPNLVLAKKQFELTPIDEDQL